MVPTLQQALPIVGAALGRKLGVQVEVSGEQAYTDGERIVLPAFDPERPEQEVVTWGFLSHEAAHIRYTDFELDQSGSAFRRRLTNLLEDIRIERALSREYPGTAFTLSRVVQQLVDDGRLGAPTESDPPVKVLHDSLLAKLRYEVLGQKTLEQEVAKANKVLETCFPAKLLKGLNAVLVGVPKLNSTRDAQVMADFIIGLFQAKGDPFENPFENSFENSGHTGNENQDQDQETEEKTAPLSPDDSSHQEQDLDSVSLSCNE